MSEDIAHAREAVSFLADYEDLTTEERYGAIKHASAALENARRQLPDEY